MIRSVMMSGSLNQARLACALGEIIDIGATIAPDQRLAVVFESDGGDVGALLDFLDCVWPDDHTRALLEQAEVKIYKADSAAAFLAFSIGSRREMAADSSISFHLPQLDLQIGDVDPEGRIWVRRIAEGCQKYETLLAQLMQRYQLSDPELKAELYSSGWLKLSAPECLKRGLVHELF